MKHILVVEDDAIQAWYFQEQISNLGYRVLGQVSTGEEALQFCATTPIDLIFMDINLVGLMSGLEAAEVINRSHNIPILLTSGGNEKLIQRNISSNPAFDFIAKPVVIDLLKEKIECLLSSFSIQPNFLLPRYRQVLPR
jgi:CheY-like chemotaxis protein